MKDAAARGGPPVRAAPARWRARPTRAAFAREVGLPARREAAGRRGRAGHVPRRRRRERCEAAVDAAPPRPEPPGAARGVRRAATSTRSRRCRSAGARSGTRSRTTIPTPLEVLRNPWIQWCVLLPREVDEPQYDDIRRAAYRALEVLGMETGLSHMEWFRRPTARSRSPRSRRVRPARRSRRSSRERTTSTSSRRGRGSWCSSEFDRAAAQLRGRGRVPARARGAAA